MPGSPPPFLPRGELTAQVADELREAGLAVVQGPAGSGATAIAQAAAAAVAPVVFVRAGLLGGLYDLAAPLGLGDAPALLAGRRDAALDAILERLRARPTVWLIDDLDAGPPDGELDLLMAALDAGELAGSGSGVLVTTHTDLAVPRRPVHPLPPLTEADAERLGGQPVPPAWRRRPLALKLLAATGGPVPEGPPMAASVDAAVEPLGRDARELLATAAAAGHPAAWDDLIEAAGIDDAGAPEQLVAARLLRPDGSCPRGIAAVVLARAEAWVPGWRVGPIRLRLAAAWLRRMPRAGRPSVDAVAPGRCAVRLAARAGDGRFAAQALLHAGVAEAVQAAGGVRPLRADLDRAHDADDVELPAADAAALEVARARAHAALGEHGAEGRAWAAALGPAEAGDDPSVLHAVQVGLGHRLLQTGDPREALPHLRAARALAADDAARSDAEHLLAAAALKLGRLDEAERRLTDSLALAEQAGDALRASRRRAGLAAVLLQRGRLAAAHEAIAETAAEAEAANDTPGAVHRRLNEALVLSLRGDSAAATAALQRLLVAHGPPRDPRARARLHLQRAGLRRQAGDLEGAQRDLDAAADAGAEDGDRQAEADRLAALGRLHLTAGRWTEALEAFDAAVAAAPPGDVPDHSVRTLDRCRAQSWAAAAGEGELPSARDVRALLTGVPDEPMLPRRLAGELAELEIELLRATLERTAPLFALRRIRRLRERCEADEDRLDTGEPALRLLEAWADKLCGGTEESDALARRAALDGASAGQATVAARAAALRGESVPPWSGTGRLLLRLLGPGLRTV